MILHCMDSSQPHPVRVEAFRLAQCFVRLEQGCLAITRLCCESIVKAIINAMGSWSLCSGKVATDQMPLLVEACKLAVITRWAGKHHFYFWKLGVDRVLLSLLLNNYLKSKHSEDFVSLGELIAAAREGLGANHLVILRPYIWAILGWLATNCGEDFNPDMHGNKHGLNVLIACGCLTLMDTIHKGRQVYQDVSFASKLEPASRAVLLMIYSPCKYIASKARDVLSELSTPNLEMYLEYALDTLNSTKNGDSFCLMDKTHTVVNLIGLSCISVLPKYRSFIIQSDGIMILSTFIEWCLSNNSNFGPRLHSLSNRTCCLLDMEDWEGGDTLLFFSLWGLAELIQYSRFVRKNGELISSEVVGGVKLGGSDVQILVDRLQRISGSTSSSPGLRWCTTYILSFFGLYGFPSRFGKKLGKALYEKELADVQLKLSSGESLRVHGVILMARCPSLLPSGTLPFNGKMCDGHSAGQEIKQLCRKFKREVRLSAHVDHQALMKLLEFVYMGFVQVDDDLVKQFKMLARGCYFHPLSHILGRKRPKWGATVPCCDFTPALEPAGHHFSDVILEAKEEVVEWTCTFCSLPNPHIHVHKIILWLSCDYMRALFHSGMQESHSQTIKVPVGWEALFKLVNWFYSDELPKPSSGCIWNNMNVEQQIQEVQPYVELCWLSEFWLLEDILEDTLGVVVSCLTSSRNLPLKIIQFAANLFQWEIVNVAANCMAPLYPQLRDSGDLDFLNEEIVDMVRLAYVRLSQAAECDYSD